MTSVFSYEVIPRPPSVGGGWRLRLLEDDQEQGGGVFGPEDEDYSDAQEVGERWIASRGDHGAL